MRQLQLADPTSVAEMNRHVNEYYPFYEDGHLLTDGGVSGQPARYVAYMLEIGRLKGLIDRKVLQLERED